MLRRKTPHLVACCKDGTVWLLPIRVLDSFRGAWKRGEAFWDGVDLWDAEVTIKLGDITGLVVKDAARLELAAAEDEEERVRRLTGS